MDNIEHQRTSHGGAFAWMRDSERLGYIKYRDAPGHVVIEHTEVGEALRGHGAGRKLVQALVEWARVEHHPVVAECEYAGSVLAKTPEFSDVVKK